MTGPKSSDVDDDLIDRFMRDLQAAADPAGVVEGWAARHPALAGDFRLIAAAHLRMNEAAPPAGPAAPRLQPGDALGDFRVTRFVAEGGMGEIYEAEQLCLSRRRVALKVIRRGRVSPDARTRFLREQEVLATLHQTNIVPVFAAGERGDLQYFAMQYIDGATLGHVVKFLRTRTGTAAGSVPTTGLARLVESAAGPASADVPTETQAGPPEAGPADPATMPALTDEYLRSVAWSLADVADALDAAHRANVLHRDVKPSNVMAEKSGKCWVIDFGLAGLVGESGGDGGTPTAADPTLTATGAVLGTFAYMAPEQFDGRPGPSSDVWALGVTLYELLTLRRPFPGPTATDFSRQVRTTDPASPRALVAQVPPDLDAICRKATQRDPADRYPTAAGFSADLRRWLRHEPTAANPPWVGRRVAMWARRNPGWAGMTMVLFVAVFAVAALWVEVEHRGAAGRETEHRLRAEAAEQTLALETAAAQQELRLRDRQLAIYSFQQERLAAHKPGWSAAGWRKGAELARAGAEPDLRDGMVTFLGGPDLFPVDGFRTAAASYLAFDPTGSRLLLGGFRMVEGGRHEPRHDRPTRVRDLRTGEERPSSQTAVGPVGFRGGVAVHLAPPEGERSLVLWDVDHDRPAEVFAVPAGYRLTLDAWVGGEACYGLVMSADASRVAALARGRWGAQAVLTWEAGRPEPRAIPFVARAEPGFYEALALSADGRLLALGTFDGDVTVWSLAGAPTRLANFHVPGGAVTGLAFGRHRHRSGDPGRTSAQGRGWLLAVGNEAGAVAACDLDDGRVRVLGGGPAFEILGLAFSPDGTILASGGRNSATLWDVATGQALLERIPGQPWMPAAAFAPDGRTLAFSGVPVWKADATTELLRVDSDRGMQVLRGLAGAIRKVTLTPDGRYAAALNAAWEAAVWDVRSGEMLLHIDMPRSMYVDHNDVRLTPDGQALVVVGGREARRWAVPTGGEPRVADVWRGLNPAVANRLTITIDGRVLLARNETKSGRIYPSSLVPPEEDPRCVRLYELVSGGTTRPIATLNEHSLYALEIMPDPAGRYFVTSGFSLADRKRAEAVVYDALTGREMVRLALAGRTAAYPDSTGDVLDFAPAGSADGRHRLRRWPFGPETEERAGPGESLGAGRRVAVRGDEVGTFALVGPTGEAFLRLNFDRRTTSRPAFNADGRYIAWGTADGAVHVCDLSRVRAALVEAGFPGW